MWHRMPFSAKRKPAGYLPRVHARAPVQQWVDVPGGKATLGVDRDTEPFTWDNERPSWIRDVSRFSIERQNVTNAAFLEFVDAGGYRNERWWRPEDWAWRADAGQVGHE